MPKRIIGVSTILFLLSSVVYAHGLYLSTEGERLHVAFSDHSPASGAVVTVVDEDGIVIIKDIMDEKGIWTLTKIPEDEPAFIIVEAAGGHLTKVSWQEAIKGTSKGFFDYLIVRITLGIIVLCGSGFIVKFLLNPKSTIPNPK